MASRNRRVLSLVFGSLGLSALIVLAALLFRDVAVAVRQSSAVEDSQMHSIMVHDIARFVSGADAAVSRFVLDNSARNLEEYRRAKLSIALSFASFERALNSSLATAGLRQAIETRLSDMDKIVNRRQVSFENAAPLMASRFDDPGRTRYQVVLDQYLGQLELLGSNRSAERRRAQAQIPILIALLLSSAIVVAASAFFVGERRVVLSVSKGAKDSQDRAA